jgi:tetratricopeptide (TPR) repeat protein
MRPSSSSTFDLAARQAEARRLTQDAIAAVDRGEIDAALATFARALELDPDNTGIAYEQAFALYRAGRFADAARTLEPLAASAAEDVVPQLLGNCYDELGQPERAMATYRDGIRRFPSSGRLHFELGLVAGAHEGRDAALAAWQHGVEVAPAFPSNYFALAMTLADTDPLAAALYGEAFMTLERATPRTAQASAVVRRSYARLLHDAQARQISLGELRPLTVGLGVLIAAIAPSLPADAATATLVDLHARVLGTWQLERAERAPTSVHAFETAVADAGHLEAYERWILGAGPEGDFAGWCADGHAAACEHFDAWFAEHPATFVPGTLPIGAPTPIAAPAAATTPGGSSAGS